MKKPLPIVTRIDQYSPANEELNVGAHLLGYAVCTACDGDGYHFGEAHLTGEYHVTCDTCEGTGELEVELEGEDAENAYALAPASAKV